MNTSTCKITPQNSTPTLPFPCYKQIKGGGFVVRFFGPTAGTVVACTDGRYEIGRYVPDWAPHDETAVWEDFHGTIEITVP